MKIGILDADLIGRKKHRFPNLACEKISGYWKEHGAEVHLLLDYDGLDNYDHVYISKVFTDTSIPDFVKEIANNPETNSRISLGGTGFYFDKAPKLPDEIEHHMPDYKLYDEWIENTVAKAKTIAEAKGEKFNEKTYRVQFKCYTDYSIGFITRGCFRHCKFCVNQNFDKVCEHSPLEEFYDTSRKKLLFLDDNFLGCPNWEQLLEEIISTGRPFVFKQGLDERLLTEEKCKLLFTSNYDGDYTFAFDNISDYDLIHSKLKLIEKYKGKKNVKFYVLVGFKSTDAKDIENAFKRIELLFNYSCIPYVMRYMGSDYAPWEKSKYRGIYVNIARWCNQPSIVKKMTYREFCYANQKSHKNKDTNCAALQSMLDFEAENPEIAKRYFDIRFGEKSLDIK